MVAPVQTLRFEIQRRTSDPLQHHPELNNQVLLLREKVAQVTVHVVGGGIEEVEILEAEAEAEAEAEVETSGSQFLAAAAGDLVGNSLLQLSKVRLEFQSVHRK